MKTADIFLKKIFQPLGEELLYRYVYLYNELFISMYIGDEFCLYGISLKSETPFINAYSGENTKIGKILNLLIRKYENIFISFLRHKRQGMFKQGEEAEFINIFDKKNLSFSDVETVLNFTFLDDYSYRRKIPDNFNIEHSILGIYHSDYECSICNGHRDAFTNFIDYSKVFDQKFFRNNNKKNRDILYTNITDYESITMGGNEKIHSILSDRKLLKKYDVISLNQTCISVIMGDDPKSIFEYNKIPVNKRFITNQETDSNYRTLIKFLMNIKVKKIHTKPKNRIIFFGLNKTENTLELMTFLKSNFNIIIDKVLIPNINVQELGSIMDCSLSVFFTGREIKAQNIFRLYPVRQIESPVPYGITKNKELLEGILSELGQEEDITKLYHILEEYKNRYADIYQESHNYGLGFIIHDFHIQQFLNDNFRGVPILSVLGDMGFKLHFFVYPTSTIGSDADLESLRKMGIDVIVSEKMEDLNKFIGDNMIHCYYSEISNDKRILSKNKQQFSVGDFEYGIEGFYRTLHRLIKKCKKQEYLRSQLLYYLPI